MQAITGMKVRVSLRVKILAGFFSVILLLFLSSMIAMVRTKRNSGTVATLSRITLPDAFAFSSIQVNTLKIQQWMSYSAATGDPEGSIKAQEHYESAVQTLNSVIKAHGAEGEIELKKRLVSLRTRLDDFMNLGMQMVEAYIGLGPEIGNTLMESFNPSADDITSAMEALVSERNEAMKSDFSALLSSFRSSYLVSIGALVGASLLSFIIAMGLANSLSKSIGKILGFAKEMRNGDLTGRMTVSVRDELGLLVDNLNGAMGSMKILVDSVKERGVENEAVALDLSGKVSDTLSASSRISEGTEAIRKNFDSLVHDIAEAVTSIERIFENISSLTGQVSSQAGAVSQTSAAIEEMSASLSNVDRVIAEKRSLSGDLSSLTLSGGEKVEATNEHIGYISKNAEAILELISMIKNVSSQTNLLAMNAAIEAAHAGEFGKGFAVVADEIRKLAETTGSSAVEVSSTLEALVADIDAALESSRESGTAFASIHEKVRQVAGAFDEISCNTVELASGSTEIVSAMADLLGLTQAIKAGSADIGRETKAIDHSLKEIRQTSTRSQEDLREIAAQTRLANRGISEVASLATKSGDDIALLNKEIAVFRTESSEQKAS
jgi:methyl-accepting chemotaxis protein